jgi:hypothetical protein
LFQLPAVFISCDLKLRKMMAAGGGCWSFTHNLTSGVQIDGWLMFSPGLALMRKKVGQMNRHKAAAATVKVVQMTFVLTPSNVLYNKSCHPGESVLE